MNKPIADFELDKCVICKKTKQGDLFDEYHYKDKILNLVFVCIDCSGVVEELKEYEK